MKLENYGCEYVNSQIFWENFFPGRTVGEEVVEAEFVKSIKELIEEIAKQNSKIKEDPRIKTFAKGNALAIPTERKTSIQKIQDEDGNIIESRKFNGSLSGASFAIAQVVGYFALARQMNPTMSLETFVNKAREHAKVNSNRQFFINPKEVIEKMWEEQRTKNVVSTRRLGQETLKEQKDTDYIDETEKEIETEEREIESTKENTQSL